jgi:hypothetical protein
LSAIQQEQAFLHKKDKEALIALDKEKFALQTSLENEINRLQSVTHEQDYMASRDKDTIAKLEQVHHASEN